MQMLIEWSDLHFEKDKTSIREKKSDFYVNGFYISKKMHVTS